MPRKYNLEIFTDTDLPNNANEIIEKTLVTNPRSETLASYVALARRTLAESGLSFKDPRLLEDWTLSQELRESLRLLCLASSLTTLNELISKILAEASAAGGKSDGIENVPSLIRSCQAAAMEIGALGTKIKVRPLEGVASLGIHLQNSRSEDGRRRERLKQEFLELLEKARVDPGNNKRKQPEIIRIVRKLWTIRHPELVGLDSRKKARKNEVWPSKGLVYKWRPAASWSGANEQRTSSTREK